MIMKACKYVRCEPGKYVEGGYDNEKLKKWLIETHTAGDTSCDWNIPKGQNGPDCECWEEDEEYIFFLERHATEDIVDEIPYLTQEEREELLDVGHISVYLCPKCGLWSVGGDNY